MAIKFECDRCKDVNGPDQSATVKWVNPSTQLVEDGHLCTPCYEGLEQIITHYMTNLTVTPEPAPTHVDVPNVVPEEWKN